MAPFSFIARSHCHGFTELDLIGFAQGLNVTLHSSGITLKNFKIIELMSCV